MRTRYQDFTYRQVMISNTFEIYHYRDPKEREVPIHNHDFYEIYFFLGGKVDYRVEGKVYSLAPGELLFINPNSFHQPLVEPNTVYERIVIWINRNYLEPVFRDCFNEEQGPIPLNVQQYDKVLSLCNELLQEQEDGGTDTLLYQKCLLTSLLINIKRLAADAGRGMEGSSDVTSQILDYISRNFTHDTSLDQLADSLYLSKYYISHKFSEDVGVSLHRYIILKRLQYAKQLMDSGTTPQAASEAAGFTDYTAFYRAFKKEFNISPRQYLQ